jgi:hypothetical protein
MDIKLTHHDVIHLYGEEFAGLRVYENGIWAIPPDRTDHLTSAELQAIRPPNGFDKPIITFPCSPADVKKVLKLIGCIEPKKIESLRIILLRSLRRSLRQRSLLMRKSARRGEFDFTNEFMMLDEYVSSLEAKKDSFDALIGEDEPKLEQRESPEEYIPIEQPTQDTTDRVAPPVTKERPPQLDRTGKKGVLKTFILEGLKEYHNSKGHWPKHGSAFQNFLSFICDQFNAKPRPAYMSALITVEKTGRDDEFCLIFTVKKRLKPYKRKYVNDQFCKNKSEIIPEESP